MDEYEFIQGPPNRKILKLKRKATVLVRLAAAGKSSSSVAVCGCVDKAIVAAKAKQGGEPL